MCKKSTLIGELATISNISSILNIGDQDSDGVWISDLPRLFFICLLSDVPLTGSEVAGDLVAVDTAAAGGAVVSKLVRSTPDRAVQV